jgi:putative SOS response-associated peptidase YedK
MLKPHQSCNDPKTNPKALVMCGRFTDQYTWREIYELLQYGKLPDRFKQPQSNFPPSYSIAPTQTSFVARLVDGEAELIEMRWGLLPHWAKKPGDGAKMINARSETVAEKPAYRSAFKSRPCLVIADGYYERQVLSPKEKQPYHSTTKEGEQSVFAGLWEPPSLTDQPTFTLLTCAPNELCAKIHDCMPVMLQAKDFVVWLSTPEERTKLLKPFPASKMRRVAGGQSRGQSQEHGGGSD